MLVGIISVYVVQINFFKINILNYMLFSEWVMYLEWLKHVCRNTK